MKRDDLARQIAKETLTSPAEAADRLDRMVHDLIRKLKRGKRTTLPGLGELAPGKYETNPKRERA
jgi:nucleoid DNA-binding protein